MSAVRFGSFGERGSFCEEAAWAYAEQEGLEVDVIAFPVAEALLRALVRRDVAYGVLPVFNSVGGLVRGTFEALGAVPFEPFGQISIAIRHCLLVRPGERGRIRRIVSHPQALVQCERNLRRGFPGAALEPAGDTASAARDLAAGGLSGPDGATAVLASRRAAELFGLRVLEADVQDEPDNATAFLVLRPPGPAAVRPLPTGADAPAAFEGLRARIGDLDTLLIRLLGERLRLAVDLGRLKAALGRPVEDPSREAELARLHREAALGAGLDPARVAAAFAAVLEVSKALQGAPQGPAGAPDEPPVSPPREPPP